VVVVHGRDADDVAAVANSYAHTILDAVQREYPNDLRHRMDGPDDRPTPRQIHPSFYGCLDWHSAVEMHWALVRLLRLVPDRVPSDPVRQVLDEHLSASALLSEAAYFETHPGFKRPYGWGWVLTLAAELADWDDADARRWSANLEPLTCRIVALYGEWLPKAVHPTRDGMHTNSAFGLARAVAWSRRDRRLHDGIVDAAMRWYGQDTDYPASWEPSGADFLSPGLAEAELMSMVLDADRFVPWFDAFLPAIADRRPATLFQPLAVVDTSDGQFAHLHGLNLFRAHAFRTIAAALPAADPRVRVLSQSAVDHIAASIDRVCGDDYMVEHWLAAYAVLALTSG
jgi:hypothetical protein